MSAEDKMLLIRNYDLWCHLSDEDYEDLQIEHHFIEVPKGEYIYFEAYNHNKIYFVKEGYIRIGHIDQDGNEKVKEIIQKGELFGQFTLERSNLHGEFAQAYKQDVSICAFAIEDFEKLLEKTSGSGAAVQQTGGRQTPDYRKPFAQSVKQRCQNQAGSFFLATGRK